MPELTNMDSSSLVAAALAPSTHSQQSANTINSSKAGNGMNDVVQATQVQNTLGKRDRCESSESSPTRGRSGYGDVFSASKKSRQNGNCVTFGEVSSAASGSSSIYPRSLKPTHPNNRDGDRHTHESDAEEEEDDSLPVITKQRRKNKTPTKHISSHAISPQELADLGITSDNQPQRNEKSTFGYNGKLYEPDGWTPSGSRHQRKVKSAHGSKTQLIDRDEDENNATTPSQTTPRRGRRLVTPTRSAKHGRPTLVLNSDPFTPSPPGSPAPAQEPEPENDDEDDSDYLSDAQSPKKKKAKHSKKATPKSTPKKSTSKSEPASKGTKKTKKFTTTPESTSKRSAAAKNRTYNFPVAHALSEASEADKMMFRWKSEGRPWKEITEEWGKIVGRAPGASSLSVRYIKLKEKFGKMGDPDFARLIRFKTELERTFDQTEKWDRISALIVKDGGENYSGQALKIKYRNLVEGGLQTLPAGDGEGDGGDGGVGAAAEVDGGEGGSAVVAGKLDDVDQELMGGFDAEMEGEGDDAAAGEDGEDAADEATPTKSRRSAGGALSLGVGCGNEDTAADKASDDNDKEPKPATWVAANEAYDDDGLDGELLGDD